MSVDSVIDTIGVGRFHIILTAIVTLINSLDFQYKTIPLYVSASLYCKWHLTVAQASLIVSIYGTGNIIGTLIIGRLADLYGRRANIQIWTLLSIYILMLHVFVRHFSWVLLLQFLLGFSSAGKNICTSYLFEFFSKDYRVTSMFIPSIGSSICSVFIAALAFIIPYAGWRVFLGIFVIIDLVASITLMWLPESPRYLETMHRDSEAIAVLQRIGRSNCVQVPSSLHRKPPESEDDDEKKSIPNFRSCRCIVFVMLITALVFVVSLMYPAMFSASLTVREVPRVCLQAPRSVWPPLASGSTSTACCMVITISSYTLSILTSSGEIPALIIGWLITYYIDRRAAITTSFTIICLSLSVTLFCPPAIVLEVCFIIARGGAKSLLTLIALYSNEVFPTAIRNTVRGIIYSIGSTGNICAAYIVHLLFIGYSSLLGIGVLTILAFVAACLSLVLPIDTRNRSLRDIETYFYR